MENETLPIVLPHGWKKEVAKILGLHPASMCRILKDKNNPNYRRVEKVIREKYSKKD